jgi:glycosyltransferase involved in cell wall biosynthesis
MNQRPIVFVSPKIPPSRDGVGDYTYCLASEIARTRRVAIITSQLDRPAPDPGLPALQIHHWDGRGLRTLRPILDRLQPAFINVQWVPFLWGKWGINFALPWMVVRLRLAGYRVVTTVHEPYVAFDRWKTLPMALLQRLELWLLICGSAKVAVSISAWTRVLQARFFWRKRDIFWLPVGSNISRICLSGDERTEIRRGLGVGAYDLLVVMFNPGGAGKMVDLAAKAWRAIRIGHPTAILLLIGCQKSDPPAARFEAADRVLCTGYVEPEQVSRFLSCADICLAPYIDGISARRGSVIAAIEHGLPIVSTKGRLTDVTLFDDCPVLLVAVSDEGGFVAGAERLAGDSAMRRELRDRLVEFHRHHFSWPAIASPLLSAVEP